MCQIKAAITAGRRYSDIFFRGDRAGLQAPVVGLGAIALRLKIGRVNLRQHRASLNKVAVPDVRGHAKDRYADTRADWVQMAVHLRVIRGFIGTKANPTCSTQA